MNLKRRKFLALSSASTISLSFIGCKITNQDHKKIVNTADLIPQTKNNSIFKFVSISDTGTGELNQYEVAKAMTKYQSQSQYQLVLLGGDNIYSNGESEKIKDVFEKPYAELLKKNIKFQAVLGKHDIRNNNGEFQIQYPNFNMNGRRYYTYRYDQVQFFALDTTLYLQNKTEWENQKKWLEAELSKSDALWKIVQGHHAIYASGVYGSNKDLINALQDTFMKHNVQLYINGHEHHYERTKPIKGTTYVTCGAGAGSRPVGENEWTAHSAEKLSFAAYEVYKDKIVISGIGTDNRIFDQGEIYLQNNS